MKNNSKKNVKKKIICSLVFALIFNIFCLSLWGNLYVMPLLSETKRKSEEFSNIIIENNYNDKKDLISFLDDNKIQYIIYDLDNNILDKNNEHDKEYLFFSRIVNIGEEKVFLKAYLKNNHNGSKLFFSFLEIQLILQMIIILILYLFSNKGLINPIEKIISDIKNYKYGKKPYRNKINGELDIIQNEFVSLTEELDKNSEEKNRIIASISHDIKTPLTSIIGYSDLIKDEKDKKVIKEYNEKINRKAQDIKEIANNFDEYLINNSNNSIRLEKITIKELTEQLIEDYKAELELNGIEFNIKSSCNNEVLEINIPKIKRVFSNLISNSVRYIKENGNILIEIEKCKNNINFKVSDNGAGVDNKIIDKIFEPLYTTDSSRKISGLGLSIVKETILYHGGDIKAYNNEIGGLTIEFNIPKKN